MRKGAYIQKTVVYAGIGALSVAPYPAGAATSTPYSSVLGNLHIFGARMGLSSVDPRAIVADLIRTGMGFVGIIMLIMILWSGTQFLFSGGNEERIAAAKKTFVNAIVGLIIMLSAYSIVAYVLGAFNTAANSTL